MRKLGIPICTETGPCEFGDCNFISVYNVESKIEEMPAAQKLFLPEHFNYKNLPRFLKDNGITDFVVRSLPNDVLGAFALHKLDVYVGITETQTSEILKHFIFGTLRSNTEVL